MKGAHRYMIILLVVFLRIKCIWGNLIFLGLFLLIHWAWLKLRQATFTIGSLNSQDMIYFMITAGYLNSQDMIRIVKQSRHDFSGKHLCDGFCKASLRICYVSLFECKGASMPKTYGLIFQENIKYFTAQQILWYWESRLIYHFFDYCSFLKKLDMKVSSVRVLKTVKISEINF